LKRRGPDSFGSLKHTTTNGEKVVYFAASVLSLRGHQLTKQPLIDANIGDLLLWNGEIFDSKLVQLDQANNDGAALLDKLSKCDDEMRMLRTFASIKSFFFSFYK
jgi:asparagine synthetase B (glutamine-hydrolysing)